MPISLLLPVLWALAGAQLPPPSPLTFERLIASLPQAPPAAGDQTVGSQEITIRWNAPAAAGAALDAQRPAPVPDSTFEVTGRRLAVGSLPVERQPELSADQLVVVGSDVSGSIVSWSLIRDPRIVRAELPGPDGALSGQVLYRQGVDLLLVLPDSAQIVQASLYEPHWNGAEWELNPIGSFSLGAVR